jgi:hypothetical protein
MSCRQPRSCLSALCTCPQPWRAPGLQQHCRGMPARDLACVPAWHPSLHPSLCPSLCNGLHSKPLGGLSPLQVLWRGLEAFQAALELVEAAEAAAEEGAIPSLAADADAGSRAAEGGTCFSWRDGILRPTRSHKQVGRQSGAAGVSGLQAAVAAHQPTSMAVSIVEASGVFWVMDGLMVGLYRKAN